MSVTLRWRMPWGAPVDERRADLCELRDHIEAVEERLVRHRDHIDSEINALNARLCSDVAPLYPFTHSPRRDSTRSNSVWAPLALRRKNESVFLVWTPHASQRARKRRM